MSRPLSVVTDEEITSAFEGTNFGSSDHRERLGASVVKRLVEYHCGHTITMIMRDMGLTGKTDKPTKRGIQFAREFLNPHLINKGG